MKTLGLIPARSGSKGILGKNLRPFAGVPLMYRALAIGQQTCSETRISTNLPHVEGPMILRRPDELAQDDTPMLPVVQHAVRYFYEHPGLGFWPDVVVILQPTQPLRTKLHVINALRMLEETGADSVVSVVQIPAHYSPDYAVRVLERGTWNSEEDRVKNIHDVLAPWGAGGWERVPRRQNCEPAYSRDGTVYAIKRETIEAGSLYGSHCIPLVIPSHESANLDTEDDWTRAESLVKR